MFHPVHQTSPAPNASSKSKNSSRRHRHTQLGTTPKKMCDNFQHRPVAAAQGTFPTPNWMPSPTTGPHESATSPSTSLSAVQLRPEVDCPPPTHSVPAAHPRAWVWNSVTGTNTTVRSIRSCTGGANAKAAFNRGLQPQSEGWIGHALRSGWMARESSPNCAVNWFFVDKRSSRSPARGGRRPEVDWSSAAGSMVALHREVALAGRPLLRPLHPPRPHQALGGRFVRKKAGPALPTPPFLNPALRPVGGTPPALILPGPR